MCTDRSVTIRSVRVIRGSLVSYSPRGRRWAVPLDNGGHRSERDMADARRNPK
jgi:hypothetical protein